MRKPQIIVEAVAGVLVLVLIAAIVFPAFAARRVLVLEEDFETGTPDTDSFSGTNGWVAGWSGDPWRSDLNGGVVPTTDVPCDGPFGGDNCWDNHLTNGEPTWHNMIVSALYRNFDDDPVGVIARFQDPANFYLCFFSRDGEMTPNGFVEVYSSRAVLIRVRDGVPEDLDRRTDFDVLVPGETHRLEIRAIGDEISCVLDDDPGDDGNAGDILLEGVDPDPIEAGMGGIYAFDALESNPDAWFDDVYMWLNDADGDELADDTEVTLGTDPQNPDTDDDQIWDGREADYGTDPLVADTDGDGLLDGFEVFGGNPTDPTNPDTDGGGVADGVEDANQNGALDAGETDPNDPADDVPDEGNPATGPDPVGCSCSVGRQGRTQIPGAGAALVLLFALGVVRRFGRSD